MSDGAPNLPFPTPPSIERAVKEHLDVIAAIEKLEAKVLTLEATQARLVNEATKDRLLLGRVEKKLDRLLQHLGVANG